MAGLLSTSIRTNKQRLLLRRGHSYQKVAVLINDCFQRWQVALRRTSGDVPVRIERGAVAGTGKGMIRLGMQQTASMRADGRQGIQFVPSTDNKNSGDPEAGIHAISGIIAGRSSID
jgi:hypothetical protein